MTENASVRLDWLSFTLKGLDLTDTRSRVMSALEVLNVAHEEMGFERPFTWDFWQLKEHPHHKPYAFGFSPDGVKGLVIMGSLKRSEVMIELQGQFCAVYPDMALRLCAYFREVLTRVDVACDIETAVRPEFAVRGHNSKTVSHALSDSGETVYIGSAKSEYMARIYRYNPPHPRSDLLRSEIVYRREHAKKLGYMLSQGENLVSVVRGFWKSRNLHNLDHIARFGSTSETVKVSVQRPNSDKTMDKRLRWLITQINPALEKMLSGGVTLDEIMRALPCLSKALAENENLY